MSPTDLDPFGEWDPNFEEQLQQLLEDAKDVDKNTEEQSTQITLDGIRENEPFGKSHLVKDPTHVRFYLQNPNGIKVEQDWMQWKLMLEALYCAKVDGFGFTETKIPWTPEIKQQLRVKSRFWFNQFRMQTSASNDPTTSSKWQPGGTCMGITNQLCGRITDQGSDPTGLGDDGHT
jgi:hypothetical protein